LNELKVKHEKELDNYPKGILLKIFRKGKPYIYLAYRDKDKVKFEYIGKEDSEKVRIF
jgi:hypothetical protein